jgi:hypothetical protein
MIRSMHEVLSKIAALPTEEERVAALAGLTDVGINTLLRAAFDPNIKFLLPEGAPPYKPCEQLDQHGRLYGEMKRMYIFVDPTLNLSKARREQLFIQILESIEPEDATLLIAVKDKSLPYATLTKEVVEKAKPGLY